LQFIQSRNIFFKTPRSYQPLAGVFAGVVAFTGGKLFCKTFSPTLFGVSRTKHEEFEKAFNTWVYYKDGLDQKN
jgi:hypothetical protein